MCVKVAGAALKWNLMCTVSSNRRNGPVQFVRNWKSSLIGACSTSLYMSSSFEIRRLKMPSLRISCSASSDAFPDEELVELIQEIALSFQNSDDDDDDDDDDDYESTSIDSESMVIKGNNNFPTDFEMDLIDPPLLGRRREWSPGEEIIPASIEWKASRVDLPLSLRIIQKKKQLKESVKVVSEATYSSMKKAFSSMVFIIHELQSYSLQMQEFTQFHDLRMILSRVRTDMNASFVWLFQQVFSPTPTLMVYIMMLLANYTVYSMRNSSAFAAVSLVSHAETESSSLTENENNGDGVKFKRIADVFSSDETCLELNEEELKLWDLILHETEKMQEELRDMTIDYDTMKMFVSPVTAIVVEDDDYSDYLRTEVLYQMSITRDPSNALLLANYAQFLYLVAREFKRAEYYFKKATSVKPLDAEAFNKYAMFLWMVKKDLWSAEESYLEAISTEPSNSYYIANYAHFLWKTGAEDTCYPLESAADESSITSDA